MKSRLATLVIYSLSSASAFAEPASWYQWNSKLNDERYCAQTSPGFGWDMESGPFKDARCEVLTAAKNNISTPNSNSKSRFMP